jgi:hypothetical protein
MDRNEANEAEEGGQKHIFLALSLAQLQISF